jgi:hypothetical protein
LLLTAIESIPSTSFRALPKIGEQLLLDEVTAIDKILNSCKSGNSAQTQNLQVSCLNQANLMAAALRASVNGLLNASTETSTPNQMTKTQVLSVIDSVMLNLLPTMSVQGHNHTFEIWVLPPETKDDRGEFSAVSVTQGTYGSVSINKDQTITYKPIGSSKADSFTVTIKDMEGKTITRTVNITAAPKQCDLHGGNFDYFGRWGF